MGDDLTLALGDAGQAGPFRQVLTKQAIEVLVAAALPSMIGRREVHVDVGGGFERRVVMELGAVVGGERFEVVWSPLDQPPESPRHALTRTIAQLSQHREAALSFDQGGNAVGRPHADDRIHFPVAEFPPRLDGRGAVFHWQAGQSMDMGPMGKYQIFNRPHGQIGGMMNKPKEMANVPPNWQIYFRVSDVDAAAERVTAAGGKILNGPMEVPDGDHVVNAMDPQGAAFGLHSKKAK